MKKILLGASLLLLAGFLRSQNNLNIVVEKYYVANAADAANDSTGVTIPQGSVTYRVYAKMTQGYKFEALYGNANHTFSFQTSTSFFNDGANSGCVPSVSAKNLRHNASLLDSWISVGAAAPGKIGVLKSKDTDGSIGNVSGILASTNPFAGIPVKNEDGMVSGTPQAVSLVGITADGSTANDLSVLNGTGNLFSANNGSIASLNGSYGADTSNMVLLGQFTTNGVFQFAMNIQIGTPSGGVEDYVASSPVGNEIQLSSLTYSSCPNTLGSIGSILGQSSVCNTTGNTASYAIARVAGASSYVWTVPTGATITSGQNDTIINVNFPALYSTGSVSVAAQDVCGNSVSKSFSVSGPSAFSLGTIAGPGSVCVGAGNSSTYSVTAVSGATFTWTAPTGATITSGQGTNSIAVNFASNFSGGTLAVSAVNACGGIAPAITFTISGPLSITTNAISGPANVCNATGNTAYFSTAPVTGAGSYTWILPTGVSYVSSAASKYKGGNDSIEVTFGTTFTTGTISVRAINACGGGTTTSTYTVAATSATPSLSGSITASATDVCRFVGTNNTVTYSIGSTANAGSYVWSITPSAESSHVSIVSGQGTTSIAVKYLSGYDGKATINVVAENSCGTKASASKTLAATFVAPAASKAVNGTVTNPAPLMGTGIKTKYWATAESVTSNANDHLVYLWSLPTGVIQDTIALPNGKAYTGTDTIQVHFTNAFVSGSSISVAPSFPCGTAAAVSLKLTSVAPSAKPTTVTGPTAVCQFVNTGKAQTYTCSAVAGATYYTWSFPTGTAATILTGQGTQTVTVTFQTGFAGAKLSVAGADAGGAIAGAANTLTIAAPVVPHAPIEIDGPTAVCAYLGNGNVAYSTSPIPAINSYLWTAPAGASIVSGQGKDTVVISYPNGFTTGSLTVASVSGCGTSAVLSETVSAAPATPVVSGYKNVCSSTTTTYTVAEHAGSTYQWNWLKAAPAGATLPTSDNTNSYTITWGSAGGTLLVTETACGLASAEASYVITKASCKLVNGELVPEETGSAELSVFPNPATGTNFNFLLNNADGNNGALVQVKIYDVLGKEVYTNQVTYVDGTGATAVINTSGLNSGVYFVSATLAGNTYKQKLVINH